MSVPTGASDAEHEARPAEPGPVEVVGAEHNVVDPIWNVTEPTGLLSPDADVTVAE